MLRRAFTPGRFLAAALALALLALGVWLPGGQRQAPLAVAVGMWPENEAFLLARASGLLPEERFRLLEVPWPSVAYRAFDNGLVQAAVFSIEDVVSLLESGEDLRIVLFLDQSLGADAVLAGERVGAMKDMKGQRVGVDLHSPGLHLLEESLAVAGLGLADVEIVPIVQPEMQDVLERGEVSAVVAAEPWATALRAGGARVLADSSTMKTPIYRVLAVKTRMLEEDRGSVEELVRAYLAAAPRLRSPEPGAEMDAVLRRQRMPLPELAAVLAGSKPVKLEECLALLAPGGPGAAVLGARMTARGGKSKSRAPEAGAALDDTILKAIAP